MYSITKRYSFSAGHFLKGLPEGHPCARQHGHNYEVEVTIGGTTLDGTGFVLDYNELDLHVAPVISKMDHHNLNDLMDQPSAENLAREIWESLSMALLVRGRTMEVAVSETPKTWARYSL